MTYKTILYSINDAIATITLNRENTLNAFNDDMIDETVDAFLQAETSHAVRCIVLTGAGRGFSSGQDLSAFQTRPHDLKISEHLKHGYHRLIRRMILLEKPIIGAINGIAAGAGLGVALCTDIRIASEKASFMLAFSKIGLIPDSGVNYILPRMIGYTRAYQMAITAEKLSAHTAMHWGMVNAVASESEFQATVSQWASQIANGATRAFGLTKRAMMQSFDQTWDEALEYEAQLQDIAGASYDNSEGVRAFIEKRYAKFEGR
jgi:2-(1,2-epoxy-1,2-dihydrophenyl)acetyl-CoA isomerase